MKISVLPPKEWLEELFEYRPEEGLFWRLRPMDHFKAEVDWYIWNKRFAGKAAGNRAPYKNKRGTRRKDHCRVQLPIENTGKLSTFSVHRIAFAMMGVEVPHGKIIDHWDEDPWNNKWKNLRIATYQQNAQNHSGWKKRKHDLPKGVYIDTREKKKPYYAMLKVGGKYERVSSHSTIEAAREAYLNRAAEVHREFMSARREKEPPPAAP